MFVHAVYFWLRPDLSDADRDRFLDGVRSLTTIDSVRHGWVGAPAGTNRPIVERTYSYSLVAVFDNQAGHDRYQSHPIHERFRVECGGLWQRVVIYDSVGSDGVTSRP
jgi:hypothetical protein